MRDGEYWQIVRHCEGDLEKHGDNYKGVGWTKKKEYADLRYRVMLEGIRAEWPRPVRLLDFGCGASHLLDYIREKKIEGIEYSGLDLSDKFLALSRRKFPDVAYHQVDLRDPRAAIEEYDFIVLNGLFNNRVSMSYDVMWDHCRSLLSRVNEYAKLGFAFNVMSKHLDWEREDLFHLPFDTIATFLDKSISRHFTIRHDYGLFEYTVYVYRESLADRL